MNRPEFCRLRKDFPHAFDHDRLGCGDGVRAAHLPRLAAHVHLDLVGDFHDHIFRDVLRGEFGGGRSPQNRHQSMDAG